MPGPGLDIVDIEVRWTQPIMLRAQEGVEIRLPALDPKVNGLHKTKDPSSCCVWCPQPSPVCSSTGLGLRPRLCCSVAQSCLTLGDPMGCSMQTPGVPVLHCLLEFVQTHFH